MKPKCIMHIPWKLLGESVSATEIRPAKMRQAFEDIGYEVYYIMGDAATRKAKISNLRRLLDRGESFDFLYSESSTLPMMLTQNHHLPTHPFVDSALFSLAKRHNIPIGLFYRDIHWAFPEINRFGKLKHWISYVFHQWEVLIYNRSIFAFFFPLEDRDKVYSRLKLLDKSIPFYALYSGSEMLPSKYNKNEDYFVYIGGIRPDLYDMTVVLKAFGRLSNLKLKICVPQQSWVEWHHYYKPFLRPNIEVVHLVNEAAQELLSKAKYALNYFPNSAYRNFVIPYKIFEFMSHNLPVLCNRNDVAGALVQQLGSGFTLNYGEDQLYAWLMNLPGDDEYMQMRTHIAEIKSAHTWQSRAKQVRDTLKALRTDN